IYTRLKSEALPLGTERPIVSALLKDHPYALFVFSNADRDRWHFVNAKTNDDPARRRLFRRISVGPEDRLRTASERIARLDIDGIPPALYGIHPAEIQKRHDEAFDVEPVTKEFYKEYKEVFDRVLSQIEGIADDERRRLFTQRLFNRLMFLGFIQKKGWLKFPGSRPADYLNALWKDYRKENEPGTTFYLDRIVPLFHMLQSGFMQDLLGGVPYLNGGLFEDEPEGKDLQVRVPNTCFEAILTRLFDRFNFTVTESTPLDVEVAVDPEMLGKVFEELVTGRHETGSYYTPKPIVSFMCREALKGYLEGALPDEGAEAVAPFVDEHVPAKLRDPEAALNALRRITVCDPACGSGAYLLGMLHELLDLRACLFKTKPLDHARTYDRKLEIIQRNLYGVDKDEFAVNIARLRLWLSLAVDFEGEKPVPLPNLKFEIERGDSLAAPFTSRSANDSFRDNMILQFQEAKARYMRAHGDSKAELEGDVIALKNSIASWTHDGRKVDGFDWQVEFAEVFHEGGFDVVLANPRMCGRS
ncbi:MAG: class I SAM-dependent DNA methyltransferase, partial [Acidobacteriota bacterium]|nr:class I SAM-dependent DNA methyltransferase [Acidobacteriota bacterium]